jgi:WD40 repeat protein
METLRQGQGTAAASAPEPPLLVPGERLEQYEIIRELGRGGMGRVYLARDTRLGRRVAIKFLLSRSPAVRQRFLAEARATARCVHENIVVIHEVNDHGDAPFMVLEHLEGRTLREHMAQGRLPPLEAVELMIPVVRALARAHESGIVHRDLKPENIFLTSAGLVKVLDFGIAKADLPSTDSGAFTARPPDAGLDLTQEGSVIGTLPFMAPEQFVSDDVDPRADLWAVGIILYWMIAGHHPLDPLSEPVLLGSARALERPMPPLRHAIPVPDALGAVVDACLRKRREERVASAAQLADTLESLLPGRRGRQLAEGESPYPGLTAFQEGDADRFFGRDRDVARAVARLREQPLVGVVGPSGVGKSSFVRAGLLPALKAAGQAWELLGLRPGRQPLTSLAAVAHPLQDASGETTDVESPEALARTLAVEPGHLGKILREHARRSEASLILFVDQFEELHTLAAGEEERRAFLACLAGVADDPASPLRVMISMRSDFIDRLLENSPFMDALGRGLLFLGPPDRAGLREALVQPVEMVGYQFESQALIDQMLDDLAGAAGALPLLQFAATKLWEARDPGGRLITQASFAAVGGVSGALAVHADDVLGALSLAERRLVRALMLRLVTPERTRALVDLTELTALSAQAGEVQRLIDHLVEARLLVVQTTGDGEGVASVEIVHESLIEKWPTLHRWLDETQEEAAFLGQLQTAARQWDARGRPAGLVWRGEAVEEAQRWRRRSPRELPEREAAFLAAALSQASRATRLKRLAVALLAAVALLLLFQNSRVERQRATALSHRRDAEESAGQLRALLRSQYEDQGRRLLLAGDPLQALAYLERAAQEGTTGASHEFLLAQAIRATEGQLVELRHAGGVGRVRFSPDGTRIATASADQTASVWDAATGRQLFTLRHELPVIRVEWSPDGTRIATASADGDAAIWDATTGRRLFTFPGAGVAVQQASFSPDGARVAVVTSGDAVELWDPATGARLAVLREASRHGSYPVGSVASFSPDGGQLAVGDAAGVVRVWDRAGRRIAELANPPGRVSFVRYAPDGARLVVAYHGGEVFVWGIAEKRVLQRFHHSADAYAAWFSPDGHRVASASIDRTAVIWDADTGRALATLAHAASVTQVAWSPDGSQLATSSDDGNVHLWDGRTGRRLASRFGHRGPVKDIVFASDGKRMASASIDGTAMVWSTETSLAGVILEGHQGEVRSASFSPDGSHVVTASEDHTARTWSTANGRQLLSLPHPGQVLTARFSPDGDRIATGGDDSIVRLWDARTGAMTLELPPAGGIVVSVAWDHAGERIMVATEVGNVILSSATTGEELRAIKSHSRLSAAALAADGATLVTIGDDDGTARRWDLASGRELSSTVDKDIRLGVALDRSGQRGVSATMTRAAKIWRLDTGDTEVELHGHIAQVVDAAWGARDELVITASLDGTARIWSASGELISVLDHQQVPVLSAQFSPSGSHVVTARSDNRAQVWELPRFDGGPAQLERIFACRVPYRIEGHKVVARDLDCSAARDGTSSPPPSQ